MTDDRKLEAILTAYAKAVDTNDEAATIAAGTELMGYFGSLILSRAIVKPDPVAYLRETVPVLLAHQENAMAKLHPRKAAQEKLAAIDGIFKEAKAKAEARKEARKQAEYDAYCDVDERIDAAAKEYDERAKAAEKDPVNNTLVDEAWRRFAGEPEKLAAAIYANLSDRDKEEWDEARAAGVSEERCVQEFIERLDFAVDQNTP